MTTQKKAPIAVEAYSLKLKQHLHYNRPTLLCNNDFGGAL